jgi:predicted permease
MARNQIAAWLAKAAAPFRHFRDDADLRAELQAHLELQAEDAAGPGISEGEARRRARLKLGSSQAVVENVRDQEFLTMLESCYRDLVLGVRSLRRSPAFFITAILTLASGIGANTAVFTLLYGLLLRSLPVSDAQQLARIGLTLATDPQPAAALPYSMLQELRRTDKSFADISAWSQSSITTDERDNTLRLQVSGLVSGNAFDLLGLKPYLGRLIGPADDVRGGPAEGWPVVLSYGFWQERFGGDGGVIGKPIRISNTLAIVVGIAPRDFHGVWQGIEPKLYLPLQYLTVLAGRDILNTPQSSAFCAAIGRLKPGVSIGTANTELDVRAKDLFDAFVSPEVRRLPRFQGAKLKVESARRGLPTVFGSTYAAPLFLMQGLVGVVLLLCSVNVSGLMLSKVHERQQEFAVRTAIGAARWRLIRQYLTESFVIAAAGAALGGAAAWWGAPLLLQFFRDPNWGFGMLVQPDRMVFVVTGVFAILTTLAFGILPAWRAGRSDPGSLLKTRSVGGQRRTAGRVFVAVQIALSLLLVTLASLLSGSLTRLRGEPTGFDLDHVTIQTPPFNRLPQRGEAKLDLYQRMVDRIGQGSSVQSAAVTWYTPMTGLQRTAVFQVIGEVANSPEGAAAAYNYVGPGYFRTMGTKILMGREFEKNERRRDICVLNQAAASLLFGRQAPLGQYLRSTDADRSQGGIPGGLSCRIVGIAEDAKFASLREGPPRTVYFPLANDAIDPAGNLVFLIHARTKADAIAAYRTALVEIAPTVPLVLFATLREQMDAALGSQRAITMLSEVFGLLALFLSAIGLYGMLASSVAQRTAEIGVRVALGAQRGTVIRMILGDALRLVGAGIVAGGVALAGALGYVKHLLYGVSAFDPATLIVVSAVLTLVSLVAAFIPAVRAASVAPVRALRAE